MRFYVYARTNKWFEQQNVVKVGITQCCISRGASYVTGEMERGYYCFVVAIYTMSSMNIVDNCMKNYFHHLNMYKGGGTEFYDTSIIKAIPSYLSKLNLEFDILSCKEIDALQRMQQLVESLSSIGISKYLNELTVEKVKKYHECYFNQPLQPYHYQPLQPYHYQLDVIRKAIEYFKHTKIGKIIWACGLGKSLLSLFIIKKMNCRSILYGVSSLYLMTQLECEIKKVFPNDSVIKVNDTFQAHEIMDNKIIITSYHSCYKLKDLKFDIKIGDEAHHLVRNDFMTGDNGTSKPTKSFCHFHSIESKYTLFMTATEKVVKFQDNSTNTFTMDCPRTFGNCIDKKSVKWAIDNKKITDYNVCIIRNTRQYVDAWIEMVRESHQGRINDELLMAALMGIKSFTLYTCISHLLLYCNTIAEADIVAQYIKTLLRHIDEINSDDLYCMPIHSNTISHNAHGDFDTIIDKFKNSKYGILPCVYMIGEGFNLPCLNGVVIGCAMNSEIRITQSLLRPNRLDNANPDKIAHIILPYIDLGNWMVEDASFLKLRTIIRHLRNVDESVVQKISVQNSVQPQCTDGENKIQDKVTYTFESSKQDLDNLLIRLRKSHDLVNDYSEELSEYLFYQAINKEKSIKSKTHYMQFRYDGWIEFPKEYFTQKGVWMNWYDFLGIDTSQFLRNKSLWLKRCRQLSIMTLDDYMQACITDPSLPPHPGDLYQDFTNISNELKSNKPRRCRK